ncbi:hypothetical protein KOW79_003156 [Hemibagrus wyckioides]|uniref:Uncharacterized protein n=1 Tax=Hemibagrus wyckioides TaxID=337641 RepID=A0A9D3SQ18_9TELE|nr:hypothetical protein KOW79_003156 [Hemibagrus wyckioides]
MALWIIQGSTGTKRQHLTFRHDFLLLLSAVTSTTPKLEPAVKGVRVMNDRKEENTNKKREQPEQVSEATLGPVSSRLISSRLVHIHSRPAARLYAPLHQVG